MKTMSVRELRQQTSHLKEILAAEGEVLLVFGGEPIARILPIEPQPRVKLPSLKSFRASMPEISPSLSETIVTERRHR